MKLYDSDGIETMKTYRPATQKHAMNETMSMKNDANPLWAALLDRPFIVLDPDDSLVEDQIYVKKS